MNGRRRPERFWRTGKPARHTRFANRSSTPPEYLLRATLSQAFFSVHSPRRLKEQIDYELLFPVKMIESGPAAGALVASFFARKFDLPSLISFDMGGTTAKACFIQQHEPLVTGTFEVDRRYRFKPGSWMPVTVPSIDLVEIGAGGGSIARIGALGLLKTGRLRRCRAA